MKVMKKIMASLVAVSVLAIGMTGLSASAAIPSSWNVHRYTGGGPYKPTDYGEVKGLVSGKDTGVRFTCNVFNGYAGLNVKCDIPWNLKKNESEYAVLTYQGAVSTCLFKNDWYALNNYSGNVNYTITTRGENGSNFSIAGVAD